MRARLEWLVPAAVSGLVALGICAYQLSLPRALWGVHGADDGVYVGAALRLAHGALPYRDFAFVHPPGLPVLASPLGILGDTGDAMAAARIVTAMVASLNAALAAVALRDRGRVAMLVAGLAVAVFPLAVSADHTLTLEPYLVLFCLLGTVTMFRGGELATPRRMLLAGALFGLAASVKVWAVLPVVAAVCVCVPLWRSALRPFASGLAVGFGLLSLPFFLLAPGAFVHDVVVAQLTRSSTEQGFGSAGERLELILGLGTPASAQANTHLAWGVALLLGGLVAEVYIVAARKSRFEWFVLAAAALVVTYMVVVVQEFYDYYSYFTAVFGALLLGVCVARLTRVVSGVTPRRFVAAAAAVFAALLIVVAVAAVRSGTSYARVFLSSAYDPQEAVAGHIPVGACVVFDQAGPLIDGNRFLSTKPECPNLVDAFGLWLTENDGIPPPAHPTSQAFVAKWRSWLDRADYAVLAIPQSDYLPWTAELTSWFESNYRLVASGPQVYVYRHVGRGQSP